MREVKVCKCGGEVKPNQVVCAECKREIDKKGYLNRIKKKKLALVKEWKICKCASPFFLIERPLSDIPLKELERMPILCLNCLVKFNTA